jgi:hypothetical protein
LTVLLLALFRRYERPLWLHLAAVAAGLGTGSKYTGVFLLVPVLLAGVLSLPLRAIFAHVRRAALICSLALASYLLTTPATVLDPLRFIADARFISGYYAHTPHGGYTTSGALQHLKIALSYLSLAYFSPYPWLALLLFVAMLGGGVLWLRRDLRFGITVAVFPLIFLVYFCIQYRLAMVRNYLFLVPFLALLLARGIADLVHWLPRRWLRICAGAALGATLIAHASFLVAAGESIRDIDPQADVERALSYIAKRPNAAFRLSAKVRALAKAAQLVLPANVVSGQRGDHLVFFGQADGPGPWHWMTNDPWLTEAVFGPREVNLNWYSSWSGNDRVVVMTLEKARSAGIALAR